jgi:hypothetical protein
MLLQIQRCIVWAVLGTSALARADTATPAPAAEGAPCETVADCWLDPTGRPIKRPARFRRRPIPRGDCEKNILWLRHRLTCDQQRCTATFIGDTC